MNLAILADIHANLYALEAVLEDLASLRVDQLVINGDLVNRGPDNALVMERVAALDAQLTLGNHDDLMGKWVRRDQDLPQDWFDDRFWASTAWCAAQLERTGWLETLNALPMTHRVRRESAPSVLISHGSPRHYREGYGKFLSDNDISEILQDYPADVLVGSHTHSPMARRWGKHAVYNTGAVGTPFNRDPRAQYLVLRLEDDSWAAEFRQVSYDRAAALKRFHDSGFLEEGGLSAHIFYEELRLATSLLTPYWMWTEEQDLSRDWETWQQFQARFPERFTLPLGS